MVPTFQIGQNVHQRWSQNWTASTSRGNDPVEKVCAVIHENRRLTVREVAEEVDITKSSCHTILTKKLEMHYVDAKFVPRLLTDEQKAKHSQSGAV
jgi:response regulator of citrate/malate metabolism